jgi:hypothetical protein
MKMQMGRKQAKRERKGWRRSEEDKEDNASNHKSFGVVTANPNFRTLNTERTGTDFLFAYICTL